MRYLCVLLVLLGTPLQVDAQQKARGDQGDRSARSDGDRGRDNRGADRGDKRDRADQKQHTPPPKSTVGTFSLPAIGLPPTVQYPKPWEWQQPVPAWERHQVPAWERPQTPAWERKGPPAWERGSHVVQPIAPSHNSRRRKSNIVYVPYPYAISAAVGPAFVTQTAPAPSPEQPPDTGFLRLEVEPAALLQIYVDGVFIGTPADLGNELELRSGPHRIEIRAPDYETLTFDARIEVDRGITYRGELKSLEASPAPAAPAQAPVPVPTGSRTLYVIPGCYLGNVVPDVNRLPASCDISRMKTHTPQ